MAGIHEHLVGRVRAFVRAFGGGRVWLVAAVVATGLVTAGYREGISVTKSLGKPTALPNPFAGQRLYVDPTSSARRQADEWRTSRPQESRLLERIASQPTAVWVGDWFPNVRSAVDEVVTRVTRAGALPLLVAYNIPARDCGQYSAGGARNSGAYQKWIGDFAAALRGRSAVVVLEPDALAADCLSGAQGEERKALLREAVKTLSAQGATVYIDAGHAHWQPAEVMAERLRGAGIDGAAGFALNVSNFHSTADNLRYGERVSRLVGGKHFVIDTSRNGVGSAGGEWCNPRGRALGEPPSVATGHQRADAFLWIKRPGESDGSCNGAPGAGEWWGDYALELARLQPARLASR